MLRVYKKRVERSWEYSLQHLMDRSNKNEGSLAIGESWNTVFQLLTPESDKATKRVLEPLGEKLGGCA